MVTKYNEFKICFKNISQLICQKIITFQLTLTRYQTEFLPHMHKSFGRFLCKSANEGIKNKISLQKEEIPQTAWLWDFVAPVTGLEPVAS